MYRATLERKQILGLLESGGGAGIPDLKKVVSDRAIRVKPGTIDVIWRSEPRNTENSLPSAIVVNTEDLRDVLAWANTYIQDFRPFTAYFRVLDPATFESSLYWPEVPALHDLKDACIGLIIGEAATFSRARVTPELLSTNACSSTLSFAMSRAMAVGYKGTSLDQLKDAWLSVRKLTEQAPLTVEPEVLDAPWTIVKTLGSKHELTPIDDNKRLPRDILTACFQYFETGTIQSVVLEKIASGSRPVVKALSIMDEAREIRVEAFEEAVIGILNRKLPKRPIREEFIVGYLASRIGPGTLNHFALLSSCKNELPGVYLWFGLLAGLEKRSQVQSFSSGLGRRLSRDLMRAESILDRPLGDLSVHELKVVTGGANVNIRTSFPGYLNVELLPCANSLVRWRSKEEDTPGSTSVYGELLKQEVAKSVQSLARVLDEARFLVHRIEEISGVNEKEQNRHFAHRKRR